jgi:hypothetical protein
MDVIAMITQVGRAVAAVFGYQTKKLAMKNTDEVRTAAKAQNEIAANDAVKTAIEKRDTDEIRKDLAE